MRVFALIFCAGLSLAPLGAQAAGSAPVESCTHKSWGILVFNQHRFGTVNTCKYAVNVWLMLRDGSVRHALVPPGDVFDSGIDSEQLPADWSAAICRAPLQPEPEVTTDNWDAILNGHYRCVKK